MKLQRMLLGENLNSTERIKVWLPFVFNYDLCVLSTKQYSRHRFTNVFIYSLRASWCIFCGRIHSRPPTPRRSFPTSLPTQLHALSLPKIKTKRKAQFALACHSWVWGLPCRVVIVTRVTLLRNTDFLTQQQSNAKSSLAQGVTSRLHWTCACLVPVVSIRKFICASSLSSLGNPVSLKS